MGDDRGKTVLSPTGRDSVLIVDLGDGGAPGNVRSWQRPVDPDQHPVARPNVIGQNANL
jgi:hypothetical protein